MTTYIALVRGINVGASTRVPMAELRGVFETLGHENVKTLLQSGNVVFDSPRALGTPASKAAAVAAIEREFTKRAGFPGYFVVLDADEFGAVAAANPLVEIGDDESKLTITFLPDRVDPAAIEVPDAAALAPEEVRLGSDAVYAWCPNGISNSKIRPAFWKQFGPRATARNVKTVKKILTILDERRLDERRLDERRLDERRLDER
jgi:uncharacterized protein (DUF1697 family)